MIKMTLTAQQYRLIGLPESLSTGHRADLSLPCRPPGSDSAGVVVFPQ